MKKILKSIKTITLLLAGMVGILTTVGQALAQNTNSNCGPQPEGNCIECGPHWGGWQLNYCPSLNNTPGVSPTTYCVDSGQSLPTPTVTVPTYTAGQKQEVGTFDCTNTTVTQTAGISYTVQGVQWDPLLSTAPPSGSFSSTAWVNVISSDPSLCGDPERVNIGSCTWNIVDTAPTTTTATIDLSGIANAMEGVVETIPVGWSLSGSAWQFSKSIQTSSLCCGDGSVGTKTVTSGSFSGSISGNGASPNYPVPYAFGLVTVQLFAGFNASGSASINNVSDSCPGDGAGHWCVVISGSVTVSGGINVVAGDGLATASGSISGGGSLTGTYACYYNGSGNEDYADEQPMQWCWSDVTLNGSVTFIGGISYSVSTTLIEGTPNCPGS